MTDHTDKIVAAAKLLKGRADRAASGMASGVRDEHADAIALIAQTVAALSLLMDRIGPSGLEPE